MSRILCALAALALLVVPAPAWAQLSNANVVASCGTPNVTYGANTTKAITQDTGGKLCGGGGGQPAPLSVATTDKSGTIASGGVAQTPIALNAARKGYCIQNPSATASGVAAESLWIRVNGTAAANVGTELANGAQACDLGVTVDTAAVSVFAATTGHKFNGFERQ